MYMYLLFKNVILSFLEIIIGINWAQGDLNTDTDGNSSRVKSSIFTT